MVFEYERVRVGTMMRLHTAYHNVSEAAQFADLRAGRTGSRQRVTYDRLSNQWTIVPTGEPIPHTREQPATA